MKKLFLATLSVFALGLATDAKADGHACGSVTIAEMNWPSASVVAHIDRFILEHGYGCDAEIIVGDTMPTGTSMVEKGEPDIAPEFWTNNFKAALAKGIEEKRLRIAGDTFLDGGEEGFWVPQYMVDKDPSLATISGIIKNASMFKHPEDPDKSGFVTCPAGWGCQITNGNMFNALNLEAAGFEKVDPGSGAALAGSIAKAFNREEAWFGYYWAPTSVLGKYNMVKVDFGNGIDQEHFSNCLTQAECAEPKPFMYPPSPVKAMTTEAFATGNPKAFEYISNRGYTNKDMNALLAWMEDEQADGSIGKEHFLKEYEQVWTAWVPEDVAAKVKKALAEL